jgi:UPF0716 family protein affecting phage T7 exclusion
MIFIVVPFFLMELYLSLEVGGEIGFLWSVIWIVSSFIFGKFLLKHAQINMIMNLQSLKNGKLDKQKFQNASFSYFIGAILLMIPGVFSDFLGLFALVYTLYLQFIARITPESQNKPFNNQGDDDVIDVEIINEYSRSDRSS